ncbi:hypothetical protein CALVIDRAFT_569296 [Calocera viscosa TUFC12733]|uniref:Uncharacterized protein n=1 Tax=Calocera viscosa (strain TUFC12733) TaxID=1330018 RepID=A0A167G5F2_CALVF|nr:hypothetical protein CALVIDRAFT_569296 [Calocera viscosa TUFC12733]
MPGASLYFPLASFSLSTVSTGLFPLSWFSAELLGAGHALSPRGETITAALHPLTGRSCAVTGDIGNRNALRIEGIRPEREEEDEEEDEQYDDDEDDEEDDGENEHEHELFERDVEAPSSQHRAQCSADMTFAT